MKTSGIISYSLLAFCLAFIGLPIYVYLPSYYSNNFEINLKSIGVILLCTRLFDTIQDPVIGILCDKFAHFRKKIIFFSSPLLGISFLLLFVPIVENHIVLWLAFFLIITYTIFSVIYISYQSLAVNFSHKYHFKTTIIAYRESFFVLGIICATVLPAVLVKFMTELHAFKIVGIVYLILITSLAVVFYFLSPDGNVILKEKNKSGKISLEIFKNKILRNYFWVFIFNAFASAIPAVLIIFFVEQYLVLKGITWLFLLLYFVGLLVGVPFWAKVSFMMQDKIKAWFVASVATVCVFSMCLFLKQGDIIFYSIICFLAGFGFSADLSLAYSYLTDIIQDGNLNHQESVIFGFTNFILKFALAVSSGILVYFIGFFEENIVMQKQFIYLNYTILPIMLKVISVILIYKKCLKKV